MDEFRNPGRALARAVTVALCVSIGFVSCGKDGSPLPTSPGPVTPDRPAPPPAPPPAPGGGGGSPATLVGAGDVAMCGAHLQGAEATARLLDGIPGTVFTAGDNTQTSGTADEFDGCFGPTWGRHKSRIRPSPGNHDYGTPGAGPYFDYFGANAGPAGLGYYSYDLGAWHIVSLNSNVSTSAGSPQVAWLRADLEASRGRACTAAYWHHPLVSSGTNGGSAHVRELWNVLYDYGVEIVMNGHDHMYERYAPQDPWGRPDPAKGIRQFVVGTGGIYLYGVERPQPNTEAQASVHGVLKLTLRPDGYDWEFISVPGAGFSDRGSAGCH
ncbi:MAG: metallophosphoesterase [Vicinamibacterales bacterium]